MSLSHKAKEAIRRAVTEDAAASEISAAIDSMGSGPAADVAANSPAGAVTVPDNTQASINTALASVVADINADRSQINAILSALKAAGLML